MYAKYVLELHYHRTSALGNSSSHSMISTDRIGRAWASAPAIVSTPAVYSWLAVIHMSEIAHRHRHRAHLLRVTPTACIIFLFYAPMPPL
jgi:hypothetical protein